MDQPKIDDTMRCERCSQECVPNTIAVPQSKRDRLCGFCWAFKEGQKAGSPQPDANRRPLPTLIEDVKAIIAANILDNGIGTCAHCGCLGGAHKGSCAIWHLNAAVGLMHTALASIAEKQAEASK